MQSSSLRSYTASIGLAWLAMLGVDFLLHAGILAGLYVDPGPFLLSPETAFARIPLGYFSFLLMAILITWLLNRLDIRDWSRGGVFGLQLGGLVWLSLGLGLYSISTKSPLLVIGWVAGQTIGSGVAGAVAGAALGSPRRGRLLLAVAVFVIAAIILTVLLQSLGVVPTVKVQ